MIRIIKEDEELNVGPAGTIHSITGQLDMQNGIISCGSHSKNHLMRKVNCEHINRLYHDNSLSVEVFNLLTQSIPGLYFDLQVKMTDNVLVTVLLKKLDETNYSVRLVNINMDCFIGVITPEFEGFIVIKEMLLSSLSEQGVLAKKCTSTSHWKSRSSEANREFVACTNLTLQAEGLCFPCFSRSQIAMDKITSYSDNDAGFSSLPKSTLPSLFASELDEDSWKTFKGTLSEEDLT